MLCVSTPVSFSPNLISAGCCSLEECFEPQWHWFEWDGTSINIWYLQQCLSLQGTHYLRFIWYEITCGPSPSSAVWSAVCSPFCSSAWLSHSGHPLAAPENKQPSLSFQGGVLTLRCLCCHLLSLFFCCRSPMAWPPVMAGVLPTGTRCGETVSVKHKHLTDPARVKILAWRPRKLQSLLSRMTFSPSSSGIANVSLHQLCLWPKLRPPWASFSRSIQCVLVLKCYF